MSWNPEIPFNHMGFLPPVFNFQTYEIASASIPAGLALAKINHSLELISKKGIDVSYLSLVEAKFSSEIEGIKADIGDLFHHMDSTFAVDDNHVASVLRYNKALHASMDALKQRPLCTGLFVDICSALNGFDIEVRKGSGTRLLNSSKKTVYTPPEGEATLLSLLSNLDIYLNEPDDLYALVKMAVAHYQFEAIHPFCDGNGRTGRIINTLYLMQEGLLFGRTGLPLSRYLLKNKRAYYTLLRKVSSEDKWDEWVHYILKGIEETSTWLSDLIRDIDVLFDEIDKEIETNHPKIWSIELVQAIFNKPYCRIQDLTSRGIVKRQTASVYLKQLCDSGILTEIESGKEKLFINTRLMKLISR